MSNVPQEPKPQPTVTLLQRLEYAAMRVATGVVSWLPEWLGYRIAGGLGALYLRFDKRRQRCALRMLRNAYPEEQNERVLLRHAARGTGNLLKVALDTARFGRMVNSGKFRQRVDLSSMQQMELQPPWIGVTGHLGSWEVAAGAVAMACGETHVIARLMKNPLAQRWLRASRGQTGLVLHDRRGGLRGFSRALQDGHITLQAIDQNQRLRGVFAPFFGEIASTERAAATLAVRRGYPIMVGACARIGAGFRFRFDIAEVIQPVQTGDTEADVLATVTRLNQTLETLIRRYPDQYLWIHDRYKTRPAAERAAAGDPSPDPD